MGKYYNEEVFSSGRVVRPTGDIQPRTYQRERLLAKLFNGLRTIYPDVTRAKEFEHFNEQYMSGVWLTISFRIVKSTLCEKYDTRAREQETLTADYKGKSS